MLGLAGGEADAKEGGVGLEIGNVPAQACHHQGGGTNSYNKQGNHRDDEEGNERADDHFLESECDETVLPCAERGVIGRERFVPTVGEVFHDA